MVPMTSEYSHMILNLLGILILILIAMYLLKKFRATKDSRTKHIKIINTVPIGAKERVILMEVNNTVLLVGTTPSHIETLYVFDEMVPEQTATDQYTNHSFADEMSALK
jgi:flagellar protein FliO/FliZ